LALLSRIIDVPLFVEIGEGKLNKLDEILASNNLLFSKAAILFDATTYRIAGKCVSSLLEKMGTETKKIEIDGCTIEFVSVLRERVRKSQCTVIFGVGGGKVLDTGKYAAAKEGINFISIPTSIANDGIASPVAVIERAGRKESLGAKMPLGIVADLKIIKGAPIKITRAGIGDLVSNLSAVQDWKLANQEKKEKYDAFAALLSTMASNSIIDIKTDDILDLNFLERLVGGLILGGIAMGIAGSSRPCSGAEHEFSHALDMISNNPAMHGEQVALGTILATYLRGENWHEIVLFFRKLGVPTRSKELKIDSKDIIRALIYAPKTRPERYTILEHIGVNKEIARDAATRTGVI